MRVLALNCGSSSLRCAVIDTESNRRLSQRHEELDGRRHAEVLGQWTQDWSRPECDELEGIEAVGHRVVHGGEAFRDATLVTEDTLARMAALSPLAPLHNPVNIAGIRAMNAAFPALPQVAVFDTAFHHTLPPHAHLYAVPYDLYEEHGIRRYGFHGLSHRSASRAAAKRLGLEGATHRILVAHLGNGCSASAVRDGRSLDTTMGATPLEGLVMGTRSGDIDPGLFSAIAAARATDLEGVTELLNRDSGLLGLSGLSGDMRELEAAALQGHAGALRAIEVFTYRLARTLASLVVPLGGLDGLVFTGGIGQNSADIRHRTVDWLAPLGLAIDPDRNAVHGSADGGRLSPDSHTPILVVATDEEASIAEETAHALARPAGN